MRVVSVFWSSVQTAYSRITFNSVTKSFFVLSVLFCFTQGILQSFLYSTDTHFHAVTFDVVQLANLNRTLFIQYVHHGAWEVCHDTPVAGVTDACKPLSISRQQEGYVERKRDNVTVDVCLDDAEFADLTLSSTLLPDGNTTVTLKQQGPRSQSCQLDSYCTLTMLYPNEKLREAVREDATLIALQFWLLGITIFALVFESIPHLIALVLARFLAVVWSSYTIWRTHDLGSRIAGLIGNSETPCHLGIFPRYFSQRITLQVVDVILHSIVFLWMLILAWSLIRVYLRVSFRCVGPPRHIIIIYRYFLAVLVGLQLSVFFLVLATSLWIDQLVNSVLAIISPKSHIRVYQAAFISTVILLIPWITIGWYSVRYERRRPMIVFLLTSGLFIAMWSLMFYSQVYRFTFVDWPFFGCLTCTAFVVMLVSIVFGILCWRRFGEGLAQYLHVEKVLRDSAFEPELFAHDAERVEPYLGADRRVTLDLEIDSLKSKETLPPYIYPTLNSPFDSFSLDSKDARDIR